MAYLISIDSLIRQQIVENSRIDYKRDWNPEDIVHFFCAFVNDIDNWGGGYIIVGIEEQNENTLIISEKCQTRFVQINSKKKN